MLKKLQHKIVFMNMLLVGVVLLAVLAAFCYNEARIERRMINADLTRAVTFMQQEPFKEFRNAFPDPWGQPPLEEFSEDIDDLADGETRSSQNGPGKWKASEAIPNGVIALSVDEANATTITYSNDYSMAEEELEKAMSYAAANGADAMTENAVDGYFCLSSERDGVYYYAFMDAEDYHLGVRDTALKSGVLWLVIMLFFFLISMFMAKVAVRPVKESWDRQQEFVADASHELKTPLTVILANNNILLSPERQLSEDDRKWVESNQEEATHMKALVDQLLFLARSDSGDQKMVRSDLDLGDMIMGDILQFEPVAFERGILIEPDLSPDVHIEGDSTMIKQLIHILLDNACKYAAEDGTIHVTLKKERQGCTFSVNNPGRPIPPEDLPHIFERFYRADKSRTYQENASGYGLGLAIAQSIVHDHGGTISCTSNEADGTTFTVRFRDRLR